MIYSHDHLEPGIYIFFRNIVVENIFVYSNISSFVNAIIFTRSVTKECTKLSQKVWNQNYFEYC